MSLWLSASHAGSTPRLRGKPARALSEGVPSASGFRPTPSSLRQPTAMTTDAALFSGVAAMSGFLPSRFCRRVYVGIEAWSVVLGVFRDHRRGAATGLRQVGGPGSSFLPHDPSPAAACSSPPCDRNHPCALPDLLHPAVPRSECPPLGFRSSAERTVRHRVSCLRWRKDTVPVAARTHQRRPEESAGLLESFGLVDRDLQVGVNSLRDRCGEEALPMCRRDLRRK